MWSKNTAAPAPVKYSLNSREGVSVSEVNLNDEGRLHSWKLVAYAQFLQVPMSMLH